MGILGLIGAIAGICSIVGSVIATVAFAVNFGRILQRIDTMEKDIDCLGMDGKKSNVDFNEFKLGFVELKTNVQTMMTMMSELSRDLKKHLQSDKED
jgi:hypothetical protein